MLIVDASRCLHQRAVRAQCRACVQACPRSAWSSDAQGLDFDRDRCDGCGLCTVACPTGALALPLQLPAPVRGSDGVLTVLLQCERAPAPGPAGSAGPAVPCLHALDEARLLGWQAQGVGRLRLHAGDCRHCARRPAGDGLPERLQRLDEALRARGQRSLRGVWLTAGPVGTAGEPAAAAPPARGAAAETLPDRGRRGLLGLRAQSTGPVTAPVGTTTGGTRPAAATGPVPRHEAAARLARLGPGPALWAVRPDLRRCDACGACARLCPTQAISLAGPAPGVADGQLSFEMAHCLGCNLCVEVCDRGALTAAPPLAMDGRRRRWALDTLTCRGCGRGFRALRGVEAPAGGRCPACRSVGARSGRIVVDTIDR